MEPWEFEQLKWKIIRYAGGILIGATLLFAILRFVASCDRGRPQDPFAVICTRLLSEERQEKTK